MYVPFTIRLYDALYAALRAGFSAQLEAIGHNAVPSTAFTPRHPALLREETVAVLYVNTDRELQAQYWIETQYHFECQLFVFGPGGMELQHRLMAFEYAANQVLYADRTAGGLLRTLKVGNTVPAPMIARETGMICDGVILPVACQPATRIAIPERAL